MDDVWKIIGTAIMAIGGGAGVLKLLPAITSNISATVAGNKASENTIEVLQELVASERAGRIAAETEIRNFVATWAEMKSQFDGVVNKLDAAARETEKAKQANAVLSSQVERLTLQVQELTNQLKQAKT